MKAYSFAPISAREYPSVKILDHPHIWGGVQFCVNVSEKPYTPELEAAMAAHGIEWIHCPVSEDPDADWLESFAVALPKMYMAYKKGKKQIVHCDLGNNRSRSFVEALFFAIVRKEFDDPYKGADNHLEYNCTIGHLPDIGEMERRIRAMIGVFPAWSMPSEDEMRIILLSKSPKWTKNGTVIQTKANPLDTSEYCLCGTPLMYDLDTAVEDYKNGRLVGEGITVDEVEMTVLDDWENVGSMSSENGWTAIYAPLVVVPGERPERLMSDTDIDGFTPVRGHEYKLKVRRIYLNNNRLLYHYYEMLELQNDTTAR